MTRQREEVPVTCHDYIAQHAIVLAQVQTGYSSILRANDVPTSPIILKKVVLLAEK